MRPDLISAKGKKEKKKEEGGTKKGKTTKRGQQKKSLLEEVPATPEIPLDPHYIKCDSNMKYFCTIRFKIFPNTETVISIVCWGKVAKIFIRDQVIPVKTIIKRNIAWVSFSVVHRFKPPKPNQIPKLLEHNIVFNVSDRESSLLTKAQDDQEQLFYTFLEERKPGYKFEVLAPTFIGEIPEIPTSSRKSFKHGQDKGATVSLSALPSYLHTNMVVEQIKTSTRKLLLMGLPLSVEGIIEKLKRPESNKSADQKKTKSKNGEKKKKEAEAVKTESDKEKEQEELVSPLTVTGEELVFDQILWFKEQYDLSLYTLYAAVWVTSDSILPEDARSQYQPMGIKIEKLENMPILDETYKKCKKVSIEYTLGKFLKNKVIRPVNVEKYSDLVNIDDTQIFLTNKVPAAQIIESFQTSKLCLKIIGFLHDTSTTYGKIFTQEREDEFFSRRDVTKIYPDFGLEKKYSEESSLTDKKHDEDELEAVLLGYAVVDCNELIYGNYKIDISAPIMSDCPSIVDTQPPCTMETFNTLDIYDDTPAEKGAMKDGQLIESGSSIRRLFNHNGNILGNRYIIPCIPYYQEDEIKTMISVFNYKTDQIAKGSTDTTESISAAEDSLLEEEDLTKKNNLIQEKKKSVTKGIRNLSNTSTKTISGSKKHIDGKKNKDKHSNLITGFAFDLNDVFLIYVEGLAEVIISEVWNHYFLLPPEQGSIVYDSDLIFTERLYGDFMGVGGVYVISLGFPIQDILNNQKAFIEGYIPTPAWKALLSTKKLLKCRNMQSAVQQNLFPTCQQLVCLDLEYGVPLYRNKELPIDTYSTKY